MLKKNFFCCILCVLLLTVSLPLGVLAADPFSQWDLTGWTKGTDDGQSIIHGDSGAQMNLLWLKGTTIGNTLSFDVRIDSSTGTVDGSVGEASNTYGDTMKGGRVYIQGYYASPSLKNLVISDVNNEISQS